ncbi:alpha/beta-hydrolase [Meredithblackwellia eburnea MCA 4105]
MSYPPFAYSIYPRYDGHNFAYKILGTRNNNNNSQTPLVLINGLSSVGLVDWLPLANHLAKSRKVLIFDNRNIGGSTSTDGGKDEWTMQDQADDVVELIKHVGWKQVDLLGFSMGGMILQTLLVTPRLPFKVKHAILAATSAKAAHSDLLSAIPDPSLLPRDRKPTEEEKVQLVRAFVYIASYDVRKKLHLIPASLPVLVIHGDKDRSVYPTEKKYILAGIPHAQVAQLPNPNIGHMWHDYFTPEFWDRLICDFLDGKEGMKFPEAGAGKKLKVGKL